MEDSIFTKIIRGDISCHKIYEDDKTFAFLDIHPVADGHALVIPKKQVEFVWDLNDEDYAALRDTTKKVALRLRQIMKKPYVGEMIVGTDVPHAHIHVVAFEHASEMKRTLEQVQSETDHEKLAQIARELYFE